MNLRIDLLKESERRYQGAVSRAFVAKMVGIVALIGVALIGVTSWIKYRMTMNSVAVAEEQWRQIETAFEQVRKMKDDMGANDNMYQQLKGWNVSRLEWHALLEDLQRMVPLNVQLTKLSVSSSTTTITPDTKENPEADNTPRDVRTSRLRMDGKAIGDKSDKTVLDFAETLRESKGFGSVWDSINLKKMQRARFSSGLSEPTSVFTIEALSKPMEMSWTGNP